ncbi:alpha-1,6-glucosidase domain-containing protein, partial [uncultured Clostridium sp.]|uniref:alpha-1,6-glucosidase domain-containing protein n=1 Tax=uncultured Clostridium sp. TaxID=59620 RepID=UPI00262D13FF
VVYWAKEYHIDGFRFDLMGIHDIETMKLIREELNKIDPTIIIYGEGWMGGPSPLNESNSAVKKNTYKFGDLQIEEEAGFANGKDGLEETIKFAIVASTMHDEVDKNDILYSNYFWANEPYQTVNYASAHDNYTLWDKLQIVSPEASKSELIKMNKLIAGIILTSQGMSFVHAGEEMARTKVDENGEFVENSFNSSDKVNKICWDRKVEYKELVEYYKGLIALRKEYKAFRMNTNKDIQKNIHFLKNEKDFEADNLVAYIIDSKNIDDKCSKIAVIINANDTEQKVKLNEEEWEVFVDDKNAGIKSIEKINGNTVNVAAKSIKVLIKK